MAATNPRAKLDDTLSPMSAVLQGEQADARSSPSDPKVDDLVFDVGHDMMEPGGNDSWSDSADHQFELEKGADATPKASQLVLQPDDTGACNQRRADTTSSISTRAPRQVRFAGLDPDSQVTTRTGSTKITSRAAQASRRSSPTPNSAAWDQALRSLDPIKKSLEDRPDIAEPDDFVAIGKLTAKMEWCRKHPKRPSTS